MVLAGRDHIRDEQHRSRLIMKDEWDLIGVVSPDELEFVNQIQMFPRTGDLLTMCYVVSLKNTVWRRRFAGSYNP